MRPPHLPVAARSISTPPGPDASPSQVTPPQFVMFPQQFSGTHLYSWVERGTASQIHRWHMRKCPKNGGLRGPKNFLFAERQT